MPASTQPFTTALFLFALLNKSVQAQGLGGLLGATAPETTEEISAESFDDLKTSTRDSVEYLEDEDWFDVAEEIENVPGGNDHILAEEERMEKALEEASEAGVSATDQAN